MQKTVLFKDVLDEWLANQQSAVKTATYKSYENLVKNHIMPTMGEYAAESITNEKILEAVDIWLKNGKKRGGGLAEKTVWEAVMIVKRSVKNIAPEITLTMADIRNTARDKTSAENAPTCNPFMLYGEWLKIWYNEKKNYVKLTTYSGYGDAIKNRILPELGDLPLSEISEEILQQATLKWLKSGRKNGGGLAENTVREAVMVVKLSLKAAAKRGLIPRSEMDIVFPAENRSKAPCVLSAENRILYTKSVMHDFNYRSAGIIFCLHTGVRIGELCALQWGDIDLKEGTVYISKTLERVTLNDFNGNMSTEITLTSPKTQSSIRLIPLSPTLINLLKPIYIKEPGAYFLTGTKKFIEPCNYRKFYTAFLKRHKLPYIKFHGLRHTFATQLIENGVDCKTVSELLGHASVNMTLNLYVHPQMEQKRRAVELLDKNEE